MPSHPDRAYPEWQGWDDWLGVPLSFDEARAVVATMRIQSQEHWWVVAREQAPRLQALRVPARCGTRCCRPPPASPSRVPTQTRLIMSSTPAHAPIHTFIHNPIHTPIHTPFTPLRPHLYYAEQWQGYTHWLGQPETPLVLPRNYGQGRANF
jgi:hypothetical protein